MKQTKLNLQLSQKMVYSNNSLVVAYKEERFKNKQFMLKLDDIKGVGSKTHDAITQVYDRRISLSRGVVDMRIKTRILIKQLVKAFTINEDTHMLPDFRQQKHYTVRLRTDNYDGIRQDRIMNINEDNFKIISNIIRHRTDRQLIKIKKHNHYDVYNY